ncbi:MAG: 35-cyclic nucleotide phosphodiesterase [Pseudomonadota bacterium]
MHFPDPFGAKQMNTQQFDLQASLNHFLNPECLTLETKDIEAFLGVIDKNVTSMHDFLQALVNTKLWASWCIEPNPYAAMILSVGKEIDRLASVQAEPAFHSKKHMMEVCLMLSYLLMHEDECIRLDSIDPAWVSSPLEKWQLLLAATAHDLGHPGLMNGTPGQLEQHSLDLLRALLIGSAYPSPVVSEVLQVLEPWVMATDHGQYKALLERLSFEPPAHVDCLAMLLVEADLAASVLPKRGQELTNRLVQEWAEPYPEKSIALQNQLGYLSFLASLQFISPHSFRAGLPKILNDSLSQLRSPSP